MLFSILIQLGFAQELPASSRLQANNATNASEASTAQESIPPVERKRSFMMETNTRFRTLFLPDRLLDTWFYDSDAVGAYPEDRPDIRAYTVGFEYVFDRQPGAWVLWAEYMGSGLEEGYWDDVETGETVDHDDGDWVRPDNFSAWWGGFNYAYDFALTPRDKSVWLGLGLGGGLGAGYVTGDLTYWHPGSVSAALQADPANSCEPGSPAYVRHSICEPDGTKEFPRFLPVVDITMSAKLNFANRAHIRVDGGFHNLLYYGAAVGGIF